MPKQIDHEKRRKQIAEATWRVILERGMEGASARNIAKEAGLSLGALRHYFSTQDELLAFAMKLVQEKVTDRIKDIAVRDLLLRKKCCKFCLKWSRRMKKRLERWRFGLLLLLTPDIKGYV